MGFFDGLMSFAGSVMDESKVAVELSHYFDELDNDEIRGIINNRINLNSLEPYYRYCENYGKPSGTAVRMAATKIAKDKGLC